MSAALFDNAARCERAIRAALDDGDLDRSEVLEQLASLSSYMSAVTFWRGPFLTLPDEDGDPTDDGTDWQAKVHAIQRTVKTAEGRVAVRKALKIALEELRPLTGAARMCESFC